MLTSNTRSPAAVLVELGEVEPDLVAAVGHRDAEGEGHAAGRDAGGRAAGPLGLVDRLVGGGDEARDRGCRALGIGEAAGHVAAACGQRGARGPGDAAHGLGRAAGVDADPGCGAGRARGDRHRRFVRRAVDGSDPIERRGACRGIDVVVGRRRDQARVHLGERSRGARAAIDVVAGQVGLGVVGPVEADARSWTRSRRDPSEPTEPWCQGAGRWRGKGPRCRRSTRSRPPCGRRGSGSHPSPGRPRTARRWRCSGRLRPRRCRSRCGGRRLRLRCRRPARRAGCCRPRARRSAAAGRRSVRPRVPRL